MFSFRPFLFPLLCIVGIVLGLIGYIIISFDPNKSPPPLHGFPLIFLLSFTIAWLFFGEFRTKMIKLILEENQVIIKRFGGLLTFKVVFYSDLDGFEISKVRSGAREEEYLYIKQNGKKIGKISTFYHKNYNVLKEEISRKIKYLGLVEFSYLDELKESFS